MHDRRTVATAVAVGSSEQAQVRKLADVIELTGVGGPDGGTTNLIDVRSTYLGAHLPGRSPRQVSARNAAPADESHTQGVIGGLSVRLGALRSITGESARLAVDFADASAEAVIELANPRSRAVRRSCARFGAISD